MKKESKILNYLGHVTVALSLLSLAYVALMAWVNPYQVMLLVGEKLSNTDSMSSIRGVYGGVGLFLVGVLAWFWKNNLKTSLQLLGLFWSLYALSRIVTWMVEGPLGDFGKQWLMIELFLGMLSLLLSAVITQKEPKKSNNLAHQ
ncbi:DUF4345 domain-containing protein [Sphingobacterium litopenaei]|uniref:DUF4345 domain-containing protein n=1 Tax=Sphingobacterium litopenaei TaxID=2763500 RepID=A0ABR7YCJ2_9SPHI|nr:DUF4345 domain-containing protein [Sphingobacterium litopenaei]MBD1428923.1 DUF4345 domain-containing protein [Sphingobacterium litopenaei]